MGASTGLVLTGTGISFANEWLSTGEPNYRVGIAGLGIALLFDGIEKINQQAATGLGLIFLITVLVTPFKGLSPVQTVAQWSTGNEPSSDTSQETLNPQNFVGNGTTTGNSGTKVTNPQGATAGI